MSGDIEPTRNDFAIALRAHMLQAKTHKVGDMLSGQYDGRMMISDEIHAYILHNATVTATQYAMDRFQQNAIHAMT